MLCFYLEALNMISQNNSFMTQFSEYWTWSVYKNAWICSASLPPIPFPVPSQVGAKANLSWVVFGVHCGEMSNMQLLDPNSPSSSFLSNLPGSSLPTQVALLAAQLITDRLFLYACSVIPILYPASLPIPIWWYFLFSLPPSPSPPPFPSPSHAPCSIPILYCSLPFRTSKKPQSHCSLLLPQIQSILGLEDNCSVIHAQQNS